MVRAVCGLPEDELKTSLDRLVASELVFQRGTPPEAVYSFKHALVQDAAHSSLLRSTRQRLHARIAEALEACSPELMDSQPEIFAQHYADAGLVEKSVAFWARAGHRSAARSALTEAAAQFQKGQDQLALMLDTPERWRQELEICSALGAVLISIKGNAAPEPGKAYARARELWEQLGSPSEFLQVPFAQARHYVARGEFDMAQLLAENLLRLSRQRNDAAGLVLAHASSGRNFMFGGRFALSRSHLEAALTLYDPLSCGRLVPHAAVHPDLHSQAELGIVLFCLGYPDQAVAHSSAAIADARGRAHPPSLALSLDFGARLHTLLEEDEILDQQADQLAALATEQSFPFWRAQATILRGWIKVKNGNVADGVSLLRGGLSAFRDTGAEVWATYHTALLARACAIARQVEDSMALLEEALQIVESNGDRWFEAELNRQKGQLLLQQGHSVAAEELYRKALSIAREQVAKLWELRASVSLARLRRDQGRHAEARNLLAPIYGWFTEGFDTLDLKEAKTLLDELSA
jgi:predicted ATPase